MRTWRVSSGPVCAIVCACLVSACGPGVSVDPLAGSPSGASGGPDTSKASNASGASDSPSGLAAFGAANCYQGSDCESGVCLPDVDGTPRCCQADCRAQGRETGESFTVVAPGERALDLDDYACKRFV